MLGIQPLVENAIRHGISKKSGGGTVQLTIKRRGGYTEISVIDDGVGFDPALWSAIKENKSVNMGVGLHNIQRRMILHYGHGLVMNSIPGKGTTVIMGIPD